MQNLLYPGSVVAAMTSLSNYPPSSITSLHDCIQKGRDFLIGLQICLTLCTLDNFACFLSSVDFFFKLTFSKISFKNTIRVSNSLDPDQAE